MNFIGKVQLTEMVAYVCLLKIIVVWCYLNNLLITYSDVELYHNITRNGTIYVNILICKKNGSISAKMKQSL